MGSLGSNDAIVSYNKPCLQFIIIITTTIIIIRYLNADFCNIRSSYGSGFSVEKLIILPYEEFPKIPLLILQATSPDSAQKVGKDGKERRKGKKYQHVHKNAPTPMH